MRFRLRTLLIVVAVGSVMFARIGYLKRQRDFHRHEAQQVLPQLVSDNTPLARLNENLEQEAAIGPGAGTWIYGPNYQERTWMSKPWNQARQHAILAHRYDRAMYRPWSGVWADTDSAPASVSFVAFGGKMKTSDFSARICVASLQSGTGNCRR